MQQPSRADQFRAILEDLQRKMGIILQVEVQIDQPAPGAFYGKGRILISEDPNWVPTPAAPEPEKRP